MFDIEKLSIGIPGKGKIKRIIVELSPEANADIEYEEIISTADGDRVLGVNKVHYGADQVPTIMEAIALAKDEKDLEVRMEACVLSPPVVEPIKEAL